MCSLGGFYLTGPLCVSAVSTHENRCIGIPTHMRVDPQTNAQAPHFKIQLYWSSGISALHAKWLWVSASHPQCETADNKIMATSAAFVVQPDDSILLAQQQRANVSSTMQWFVLHRLQKEQCGRALSWWERGVYFNLHKPIDRNCELTTKYFSIRIF